MIYATLPPGFIDQLARETADEYARVIAYALDGEAGLAALSQTPPAKAPSRTTRRAVGKKRPRRGRGQRRGTAEA